MVKRCERQLTYLVRVINSLLSYGMPSGISKQKQISYWPRRRITDMQVEEPAAAQETRTDPS